MHQSNENDIESSSSSSQRTTSTSSILMKKKKKKKKPTRTLSWASTMVLVKEIECYQNPKRIWYQQDELKMIRNEIRDICSRFCITDDFRGLEAYMNMDPCSFSSSSQQQRTRTQRRREVTRTVLEEQQQHDQRAEHHVRGGGSPSSSSSSPESIAELYQELSSHFLKEAQVRGLQDQKDAADTYRVEEEEEEQEQQKVKATKKKALVQTSSFFKTVRRPTILRPKWVSY